MVSQFLRLRHIFERFGYIVRGFWLIRVGHRESGIQPASPKSQTECLFQVRPAFIPATHLGEESSQIRIGIRRIWREFYSFLVGFRGLWAVSEDCSGIPQPSPGARG